MLIDSHCHLDFEPLIDDVEGVLARSRAAGVTRIIVPSYDAKSRIQVAELAEEEGVYPAFGLHPWVADEPLDKATLREMLSSYRAVAVGEIGLDSKIPDADLERQTSVLRMQLDIAREMDLPVLLHCRGVFEEMIALLKDYAPLKGVVHAFSRGPQLAERFIELGLHLAFGGAITHLRARRPRRSAQVAPLDRILLETDAPAIALSGVPPENVEPRHIADIARELAEIRNLPESVIIEETTRNAESLFRF